MNEISQNHTRKCSNNQRMSLKYIYWTFFIFLKEKKKKKRDILNNYKLMCSF